MLKARATVSMKMKRPAARDMTPLKSDSSGQFERCHFEDTQLNRLWANVRKSALDSPSPARSYRKCDKRIWGISKNRWMSTSGQLVTIDLSHGACEAASVKTFRKFGRLRASPHSSRASMTRTRLRFGWRGMERRKSRRRGGFIDSGVRFGSLRRRSATTLRKRGKIPASLLMRVGRIFLRSLK